MLCYFRLSVFHCEVKEKLNGGKPLRILLLEDQKKTIQFVEKGLTAAGYAVDCFLTPPEAEETYSNQKVALEEIDMLSSTITNLLNLVQIESGFQNFNSVEVDLLDHVMSEVDRLDYLARKKGLKFQIKCIDQNPNQPDWCIKIDPQLLSIIFGNLLENSIKYAFESPIEIKLESTENLFIIAISNQTDPKTDPMISPNLRDKFIRGNTPEPGQGLGLYIAYKIASILNINLSIENLESAFIVKLEIPNVKPKILSFED